jgi:probable HAF family extracellular repeat protein
MATDVNDADVVVGGAQVVGDWYRPFRWTSGGGMVSLGTLGKDWGSPAHLRYHRAEAINAAGLIVGTSITAAAEPHGFIWESGAVDGVPTNPEMKDLGTLGGTFSQALGINNSDWVVGWSTTAASDYHAFTWLHDTMVDLNDEIDINSTWELTQASDINNDGYITGWGTNPDGDNRAFNLEPTRTCQCDGGGVARPVAPPESGEDEPDAEQEQSPAEGPQAVLCGAGVAPAYTLSLLGLSLMSRCVGRRRGGRSTSARR